jgi:pimeloyl-ACP methyl ester carboxylesterase
MAMPWTGRSNSATPPRRAAQRALLVGVLVIVSTAGCSSAKMVTLRSVPRDPLADTVQLSSSSGSKPSQRTMQLLRVYDLTGDLEGDPRALLTKVETIIHRDPSADRIYAFAELSYLKAKQVEANDPKLALHLYGASVLRSYQYLFDERFAYLRNPYDPQFRRACDLYNAGLEGALRRVCKDKGLLPDKTYTLQTASGEWDITCVLRGGAWWPQDFERFEFVSDYEVKGLKNHYQTYGLGVPLIAVRRSYPTEPPAARYYPPGLSFPVTAFLRPVSQQAMEQNGQTLRRQGVLELYDPLSSTDIPLNGSLLPLESDLTTPLAYYLSNPAMGSLATAGLLRPDVLLSLRPGRQEPIMGLYMVQPYESGKIPVVMVHGLWSSPMTWMEMFNDLRSSPEIRNRYQFWFYLYPTSQPFWISAGQMRGALAEARAVLDPQHREPALDQMVLIGHSMGGLVSKLQTLASGDDYWHLVSQRPLGEIKADDEVRGRLQRCFYFQPNPSVRRVITIATPHHGSDRSNPTTQWLSSRLIGLPTMLLQGQESLFRENQDAFGPGSLARIVNSIDSLSPTMPIFPVMLASPRLPVVKYHNIIGRVPRHGLYNLTADGDGVVSLASARIDGVASELVVPADHTSAHTHPLAVLEVRRILLEHLLELRSFPYPPPETQTAELSRATR